MLKNVFLAAAASMVLAGATMAAAPAEAGIRCAKYVQCLQKAKAAGDLMSKERRAAKKVCHARRKAWKKAHNKGLFNR
jgi:hypothetical protein